MTERHPKESFIGHAGRLVFQPFGVSQAEDCDWQSARDVTQNGPCFKDLGVYKKWYSGKTAPQSPDAPSGGAWLKCRRQKIWLLKSYSEARLGNGIVHDLLSEALSPDEPGNDASWRPTLFAVGDLTDSSNARGSSSAPFLALAVGGANNILRLARLTQNEWQWGNDETVSLRLLDVSDHQPATWEDGIGPIRRIRCVVDSKRYDPTRWLIVQWESETRVFRPNFGKIPIGPRLPDGEEPSRIAVSSLFSLSKRETGDSPHADAAFNPGTRSKPAQLGLIDERGYWSIWDVAGIKVKSSRKPRINLNRCGHIQDGILKQLPYQAVGRSDWHTIFWAGGSDDPLQELEALDIVDDPSLSQSEGVSPPLERSSTLVLGNSRLLRLLDLNTNVFLPGITFVPMTGLARILDAQLSPQDPRFFFVLTTSRLFVAGLFSAPGLKWDQPTKRWSVLLSVPHHRDSAGPNLKLNLAPGANSKGQITTLATIYATGNTWLDIFHVHIAKHDPELLTFYHEGIELDVSHDPLRNSSLHAIQLRPVAVATDASSSLSETAQSYVKQQVRFYQLIALDTELNVMSKLCVSSTRPVSKIVAPNNRIEKTVNQWRERKQDIKHLGARFVVPDYLPIHESGLHLDKPDMKKKIRNQIAPTPQRFLKLLYGHFRDVFGRKYLDRITAEGDFGSNPFDDVQYAVQEAIAAGRLPATTLLQLIPQFNLPENVGLVADEWDVEVERFQHIDPNLLLLDLGLSSGREPEQSGSSLGDVHTRLLQFAAGVSQRYEDSIWTTESRPAVLRKMACDLYLSSCGLIYGKPDLTVAQQPEAAASQGDQPDDLLVASSPAPQSQRSSSVESQATIAEKSQDEDDEEPAMALLRSYTDSGKFVPRKRFELLGQWTAGTDPDDYVFDLDKQKEVTPGMQRRAKMLARESKKRRRAESLLQASSREPSLPPTQPAPEARFSQRSQPPAAFSSQAQFQSDPVTMSQPVAGPFAQRPKKRLKRKGGF